MAQIFGFNITRTSEVSKGQPTFPTSDDGSQDIAGGCLLYTSDAADE